MTEEKLFEATELMKKICRLDNIIGNNNIYTVLDLCQRSELFADLISKAHDEINREAFKLRESLQSQFDSL